MRFSQFHFWELFHVFSKMLRQEDDVKKTAAGKKQSDEIGGIHLQVNKEPEQEAQQEPGSKNQVKV